MSYVSIRHSLNALLHFLFAMNVFMFSGSARRLFFCRCFNRLTVALIVVSSYAFFFIQSITFIMVGDGVVISGDDDAVPV